MFLYVSRIIMMICFIVTFKLYSSDVRHINLKPSAYMQSSKMMEEIGHRFNRIRLLNISSKQARKPNRPVYYKLSLQFTAWKPREEFKL